MTPESNLCEVIITAPDADWLAGFSKRLLADRLCAAVHHFSSMQSSYWWQGEMRDAAESRVALHTCLALVPPIVERTNNEHPYKIPCVAVLPISGGNPAYLAWIAEVTSAGKPVDTNESHEPTP